MVLRKSDDDDQEGGWATSTPAVSGADGTVTATAEVAEVDLPETNVDASDGKDGAGRPPLKIYTISM